ncbi:MAG: alginate lyase family protein [Cocleimonas sp.]
MKNLHWLWNRLQCMSLAEISYRFYQKGSSKCQQYGFFTANNPAEPAIIDVDKKWLSIPPNTNIKLYTEKADQIISGNISVFSLGYRFNETPDWNYDVAADKKTPRSFGKGIDYRNSDLVGDIKYVWEPNRHLHFVTLGQAFALTGDKKYSETLDKHLSSWLNECPYPQGLNWTSSLELGIRLINWSMIWQLVYADNNELFESPSGKALKNKWLDSIYQHCHFINGHWSRYSSSNNHLIGEAAGLYIASVTWPYWKESAQWRDKAQKILIEEALKQNYNDGVNKEQAISYQQFVLDFLIFAGLAARSSGLDFPKAYWGNIEKMIAFIASIMDVKGNIPMIGDADDGYVSDLSQEPDFCPYKSLLATGAVLFNRADFKFKAGELDDKSQWLVDGDEATKKFESLSYNKEDLPVHRVFSDAGYYILGTDFETDSEIKMLVDVGPLGYLSIAAHGHADALAVTLSVAGKEFLIDPGTYAYHTQKKWRDYFRGTSCHNTVCLDNVDQSVAGGNFMWVKHANSECVNWSEDDNKTVFVGKHEGYQRLDDAVTHSREIILNKQQRSFFIKDTLECQQVHSAERFWHFSEKCEVSLADDGSVIAINEGQKITLKPLQAVTAKLYRGNEDKPLGWISRNYDVKKPTTTVVWMNAVNGTCTFDAMIECT